MAVHILYSNVSVEYLACLLPMLNFSARTAKKDRAAGADLRKLICSATGIEAMAIAQGPGAFYSE